MTALPWSDELALGQPQIDDTHREFAVALNALDDALDGPAVRLQQALDALVAHTEDHFAQEDAWMAQLGFTPDNCHAIQHRQVLEVLHEVQRRLRAEPTAREHVRELVPGLAPWFLAHVQMMDAALAQVMAERGFDAATGRLLSSREAFAPISGCGSAGCA